VAVTFTPPKQWEDWCDWGLGIWLVLSPWVLLFEKDTTATRNAVIVGGLIVLAEVVTLSYFRVWEEWINVALGAWLAVSPWVLGITSPAPKLNFHIVGVLVAALALYEVWEVSRNPDRQSEQE
jgi:SPW repeat-containing protein